MSDTEPQATCGSCDPHDWHLFDAEAGLEVRQVTAAGEPNLWEVRRTAEPLDGDDVERYVTVLDDARFAQLREHGPGPVVL